jgi:hypothetical protein
MRILIAILGMILYTPVAMPAQGGSIMFVAKVTPGHGVVAIEASSLRPIADIIESAVLDQCFELGMVISTFPPLLYPESSGLPVDGGERINLVYQAQNALADWLVVVSIETGPLPKNGLPLIQAIQLEVHRLDNGIVKTGTIPLSSLKVRDVGKEIGMQLHGFL